MNHKNVTTLRMERQHLIKKADETEYIKLYRDCQPGQNVYWNGFGDPPSLTYRAGFNDIEFNFERQKTHTLLKGRFAGGNIGFIVPEDLELFAAVYRKSLNKPMPHQLSVLNLIEQHGALTIQQIKEETGMLVKEITPVLHRLQEAFLIYEDQYDGKWDRGWHKFSDMFPDVDLLRYSRHDALKILLRRFAYRHVSFDIKMVKSFYKLPEKEIKAVLMDLVSEMELYEEMGNFILCSDAERLNNDSIEPQKSIFAMHRNDFLVKSNEHWLKEKFSHSYPDTLYYLLINGEFRGVVAGKFRYTPEVLDVLLDLPSDEAAAQKDEILQAVHILCGANNIIKRYQGEET